MRPLLLRCFVCRFDLTFGSILISLYKFTSGVIFGFLQYLACLFFRWELGKGEFLDSLYLKLVNSMFCFHALWKALLSKNPTGIIGTLKPLHGFVMSTKKNTVFEWMAHLTSNLPKAEKKKMPGFLFLDPPTWKHKYVEAQNTMRNLWKWRL